MRYSLNYNIHLLSDEISGVIYIRIMGEVFGRK